ncbi:hypothetical protein Herbaro_09380 [Herbaspirillum sp. WKF16]|uniref:hypothetical protein n=1 Tax=Herbaspirillum sp. WKF16 TaxID=3028312 RepID=UPI0023A9339B|nr:hypothetical protein [Herbaspirillum sp. WKF16]WDZ97971.1 hypothetical protein Herbaro_09380 [Herbaspirillum sp. WKF16]
MHFFSVSKLLKNLLFNFFRFHAAGDGGGGSGGLEITPEIQAVIDAAVADATSGLKTKNGELLGDQKKLKEALKQFDGLDATKIRELMARFENDEEAQLIADGKINEVIERRTEKLRTESDRRLKEADDKVAAAEQRASAFQGRVLDDTIRAAASTAGLHPHAIEDALFRGRTLFTLDKDGKAVQLGEDGHPVLGKDGKSPFTPAEWLDSMKDTAPHWFPTGNSGGGGGAGGNHRQQAGKTMTRAAFDALDPSAKAQTVRDKVTITD